MEWLISILIAIIGIVLFIVILNYLIDNEALELVIGIIIIISIVILIALVTHELIF